MTSAKSKQIALPKPLKTKTMKSITLGIIGGGQLGRMSAIAAAELGIKVHSYAPEDDSCPAAQVCAKHFQGGYNDQAALKEFAQSVDVISYEFENIPVETVRYLKTLKPVYPDERLLEISQDRIAEKSFLNSINIDTARWEKAETPQDIENTLSNWDTETVILKTTRFGYDGKGQAKFHKNDNAAQIFDDLGNQTLIIEDIIDFKCEISMIAARDINKNTVLYGPMLNEHKNHILHKTTFPSGLPDDLAVKASEMITNLAEKIDLHGVLTLELFVTNDNRLLANEIAPRTHNSGHWSIDGCLHSQFENHVRAVCGLPVLPPEPRGKTEMVNLIGDDVLDLDFALNDPNQRVHLYGKTDIKKGRKMGHLCRLAQP